MDRYWRLGPVQSFMFGQSPASVFYECR